MKTSAKQTRPNSLTLLGLILVSLVALGCDKKSDGGGAAATPTPTPVVIQPFGQQCSDCQNIQTNQSLIESLKGQNDFHSSATLNLKIFAEPISNCSQPAEKQIFCAQGKGVLTGQMIIHNNNYFCGQPVGTYTFEPLQSSNIQGPALQRGRYILRHSSGAGFILDLNYAFATTASLSGLTQNGEAIRLNMGALLYRLDNAQSTTPGASCGVLMTY